MQVLVRRRFQPRVHRTKAATEGKSRSPAKGVEQYGVRLRARLTSCYRPCEPVSPLQAIVPLKVAKNLLVARFRYIPGT